MAKMFVYILKCADNSYYVGITGNLEQRLYEHQEGKHSESYTFKKRPVELLYYEGCPDYPSALGREKQIKGWTRKKKEALINENWEDLKVFAKCLNESSHTNVKPSFGSAQDGLKE